jgi:hypothetical protein
MTKQRASSMSKSKGTASQKGRPSKFTAALGARICTRLAAGETLRAICRDEDMPPRSTVRGWALDNEAFSEKYARAREIGYQDLADDLIEISDDKLGDPARDRLRVDTRKWLLSKALPKLYGDKLQHTGGGEGDPPIAVQFIELRAVRPNDSRG